MWGCPEVVLLGGVRVVEGQLQVKMARGGCTTAGEEVPRGRDTGWATTGQRCGVRSVLETRAEGGGQCGYRGVAVGEWL